jgi:hypothetical protein
MELNITKLEARPKTFTVDAREGMAVAATWMPSRTEFGHGGHWVVEIRHHTNTGGCVSTIHRSFALTGIPDADLPEVLQALMYGYEELYRRSKPKRSTKKRGS